MRLLLIRAVLVCWAICIPLVSVWGHAEALLLALGQSPPIAAQSAAYLAALAPSMFCYVLSECLQAYLVVQVHSYECVCARVCVRVYVCGGRVAGGRGAR